MELTLEYFFSTFCEIVTEVMDLSMKIGLEPKPGKLDAKHMTLY